MVRRQTGTSHYLKYIWPSAYLRNKFWMVKTPPNMLGWYENSLNDEWYTNQSSFVQLGKLFDNEATMRVGSEFVALRPYKMVDCAVWFISSLQLYRMNRNISLTDCNTETWAIWPSSLVLVLYRTWWNGTMTHDCVTESQECKFLIDCWDAIYENITVSNLCYLCVWNTDLALQIKINTKRALMGLLSRYIMTMLLLLRTLMLRCNSLFALSSSLTRMV